MKNFFTWEYWFSVNPEQLTPLGFTVLIGLIILFVLAGVTAILLKKRGGIYRGLYGRIYNFSLTNFLLGLLFLFFNRENIPFFIARFWLAFWFIGMGVWIFFIVKRFQEIPAKKKALEAERERKKYLP